MLLNIQKKHRYIKYKVILFVSYLLLPAPRRPHPPWLAPQPSKSWGVLQLFWKSVKWLQLCNF